MTSKRKLYREDEKLFFLHSYYQSGMSKHAFCRAHGICCPALLNSWIKKYSNLAEELSLPSEQESPDMSNRSKEAYKDENAQLKKRIKELEKALSFSKLETEARELMITRADNLLVYTINCSITNLCSNIKSKNTSDSATDFINRFLSISSIFAE